jgi:hypothetical protein
MIVPFIALMVVFLIVIYFISKNAKQKDKGNRPDSTTA